MYNGLIPLLLLYQIKYLNEHVLPYESLLDIVILAISILFMSVGYLHLGMHFY